MQRIACCRLPLLMLLLFPPFGPTCAILPAMPRLPPPADPLGVLAVICCLGTHALACAASLLVLLPGSPLVADPVLRATYLTDHPMLWALMWATWAMAALSLFGFYWALGSRLENRPPRMMTSMSWIMLFALGVDISSQAFYAAMTPGVAQSFLASQGDGRAQALARLLWSERMPALLSGGVANGLYALAGLVLCTGAARDPRFPRVLRWLALPAWSAGLACAIASVAGDPHLIAAGTALAIGFFMLWCAAVGGLFFWRVPPAFRTQEAV